ncbi:uncharacterized protein LOC121387970 [Gigantopelta aegis]|uniref:uncharacterized protein LOC121387970 n=1 Tax=Gigantopelta aegis TaxID=1735272 RepID=UPI001B88E239|nr:uncharacterized protein LOC121387970 [Gigantopelta aegis]
MPAAKPLVAAPSVMPHPAQPTTERKKTDKLQSDTTRPTTPPPAPFTLMFPEFATRHPNCRSSSTSEIERAAKEEHARSLAQPAVGKRKAEPVEGTKAWTLHGQLNKRYSKCYWTNITQPDNFICPPHTPGYREIPDGEGQLESHVIRLSDGIECLCVTYCRGQFHNQALLLTQMDNVSIHRILKKIFGGEQYPKAAKILLTPEFLQFLPNFNTRVWLSSP